MTGGFTGPVPPADGPTGWNGVGPDPAPVLAAAAVAGVPAAAIGAVGGAELKVDGASVGSVAALKRLFEGWLPQYMS